MKPRPDEQTFRVRYENAFPSFFTADIEKRVRSLITHTGRHRGVYGDEGRRLEFAVLRTVRCAFERKPGERCGRVVRPVGSRAGFPGHSSYRAQDCGRWQRPPHSTGAPLDLGEHVLDLLCEVFSPARLRAAAEGIRVDAAEVGTRRNSLETRIREAQDEESAALGMVLDAETKRGAAQRVGDEDAMRTQARLRAHWEGTATDAGRKVARLSRELDQVQAQEDEYLSARSGELDQVIALGTDLRALIERARTVPFALQRMVEALTTRIWLRHVGRGVFEFSVEFPSGAEVRRIFTAGAARGTQAQRLLAHHRLAEGVELDAIGQELATADGGHQGWPPSAVLGAAAYAEHFEHELPRDGDHRGIAELALMTGEPDATVRAEALAGGLGPARWAGGDLALCPTETELHQRLPNFARREVARVNGLGDTPLVRLDIVQRANRLPDGSLLGTVKGCESFRDAARMRWLRVEDVRALGLAVDYEGIGADTEAAVRAAVATLGEHAPPASEFVSAIQLARDLSLRFPSISYARIHIAVRTKKILSVRARGRTERGKRCQSLLYVHAPQAVRDASSIDLVSRWLSGRMGTQE